MGNVSVLIAIGVGTDGHRRVLGVVEGAKEDKAGWGGFLRHLKSRGLGGEFGRFLSGSSAALCSLERVQRASGEDGGGEFDAEGFRF